MAALPSPTQVAGTHCAIYEAYYHQVDPSGTGAIQALDAARFLKKSRLSDVVLSKIWDLSDPNGKGYLDKTGLFVALKLVALAQAGKDINMSNIHSETPPPKVGELPKVPPSAPPARPAAPSPVPAGDWTMKPQERDKYSQLFDSLQPNNGLIAGNKVKGVLMESKLPLDTLGKIWDLADQDKDGMLDRHEFMVAMHLVYKALEKHAIPTSLPAELRARRAPSRPPSRPASRPPSRAASPPPRPVPPATPAPPSNASLLDGLLDFSSPVEAGGAAGWPPAGAELTQFAAQFRAADADRDGFVSGLEIKDTFLNTGLSHQTLAHIWALCDRSGSGRLSWAEFALGMWLVARARAGHAPALPHNYQPLQDIKPPEPAPTLGPQPTPEMEAIVREIDALAKERLALEAELNSKERELGAANNEADGLQSELDTLTATLKQLENQKGEAQKRLNDLKTQVEKLRCQVAAQEAAAAETEGELESRRAARDTLRARDDALRADLRQHDAQLDDLSHQLTRTALAISQANIKIAHLEEQLQLITSTTEALAGAAPRGALALSPQYSAHHLDRLVRGATPSDALEEDFSKSNGFANGPSAFDSDPFKDAAFPAPAADPFAPAALHSDQSGFNADPFGGSADPFAGDAFAPAQNNAKDDSAWENDPFAVLHAPTRAQGAAGGGGGGAGGGAAGGPALPPKRHKTPPPRPAPPRPNPPHKNTRAAMDFTDDPFKDYRYEDPFNIEDPFADVTDSRKDALRPTSVAGFETDDFFGASAFTNGGFPAAEKRSGRVSAPPSSISHDPFSSSREIKSNKDSWSAWPNDNWADDSAWAQPSAQKGSSSVSSQKDAWAGNSTPSTNDWTSKTDNWANKTDNWANKTENWATDWNTDQNKNLNETWPSGTLPAKKEKSPKPVKYAKSLVHTIGGIGRTKQKKAKAQLEARSAENLPSEEQQWAWAAAESRRLEQEAENRRRQEDAELQLALAISRQEK